METLIHLSNELLVDLMTYGKALDQIQNLQSKIGTMCRQFARQSHRDVDIILARIATAYYVLEMYNEYRLDKWEQIHELADEIRHLAVTTGFTSYGDLFMEDRFELSIVTSNHLFMTNYYMKKDKQCCRPN